VGDSPIVSDFVGATSLRGRIILIPPLRLAFGEPPPPRGRLEEAGVFEANLKGS
jgi:hypothetical protein